MNSKGILAIKDTKNLCYKCLKKKDKIQKINIGSRGYGSYFDNFSTSLQLCDACYEESTRDKPIWNMKLLDDNDSNVNAVKEYAKQDKAEVIKLCVKIEEELSSLDGDDKKEMLEGLGLDASGLDKLITATYDILGLATYFTVGKDEVRAWTFKKGMNAKQCAGIIHTDFEKGFIRAEVISYTDLIELGSELKVKEAGKARLEGKDYLMQDGDICHFRFNV